jgi:S-DNA-T family DNA segregation ATPase FtsK/SpoIIIE
VIWSLLCGVAPAIRDGLVRVWAIDPKGGMELAFGAPLFDRFLYGGPTADGAAWQEATAQLLEDAVRLMQERAARCRGMVRLHTPTPAEPLVVVVIDEVASLTAYVTDTGVKKRLAAAMSLLLSQGRAVGVTSSPLRRTPEGGPRDAGPVPHPRRAPRR